MPSTIDDPQILNELQQALKEQEHRDEQRSS